MCAKTRAIVQLDFQLAGGNLIGVIAPPGMGKSLFLTALANESFIEGRKVCSIHELNFDNRWAEDGANLAQYTPITFDDVVNRSPVIEGADVFLDEIGEIADTYDFYQTWVRSLGKTVKQGRKDDARTFYSIVDYWILPPRIRRGTMTIFVPVDLDWQEFDHSRKENFGRCKMHYLIEEYGRAYTFRRQFLFDGEPYKNMYNTHQKIAEYTPPAKEQATTRLVPFTPAHLVSNE